jgi:uncharacterized protein with HEPN domain
MPRRSWEVRIADIAEAIETVLGYTSGMTFEQFVSDRKTVDAVIRNLIVIGEAASHVPENVVAMHPGLPWREMRDMRNIAVHEYFGVDDTILWETVKKDLPSLLPMLRQLIGLR